MFGNNYFFMLDQALVFIEDTLNNYLMTQMKLTESVVVINPIVGTEGKSIAENENKLVISLINLENESNQPYNVRYSHVNNKQVANVQPDVRFNLDLLLAANFSVYEESLKFLSSAIGFFQLNPSLDEVRTPQIPKQVGRLDFHVESLNYFEMHNLWSSMGAKYQPSIVYKVRLVKFQGEEIVNVSNSIVQTGVEALPIS